MKLDLYTNSIVFFIKNDGESCFQNCVSWFLWKVMASKIMIMKKMIFFDGKPENLCEKIGRKNKKELIIISKRCIASSCWKETIFQFRTSTGNFRMNLSMQFLVLAFCKRILIVCWAVGEILVWFRHHSVRVEKFSGELELAFAALCLKSIVEQI